MGQQMFMMKNEVVSQPSAVMILFKVLIKKFLNDNLSQFQNSGVNFHKFHALCSM
jgi:hypothetical protein